MHLTGPPYPVTGLGGRSLADEWAGGAQAYKSINAHGYPNLFFMTGPNSGPGHNSLLVYVEGQLDYAVRGITTILRQQPALSRCARGRPAPLQRAHPEAADQDDLDVGLQQLVSDRGRIQRVDVPGVRHPVSSSDAGLPIRRLRRGGAGRARRLVLAPARDQRPDMPPANRHGSRPARSRPCLRRGCAAGRATSSRTRCRSCSTRRSASARRRGVRRIPHRGAGPAGGHHHPQHPGVPRPRPAASAAAGRPHRAVQRHPSDPAAADHLDARPRLQHRACARDALRLGAGQGPRRHARPGVRDRGQLGDREAGDDAARRRQAACRRRRRIRADGRLRVIRIEDGEATSCGPS